MVLHCSINHAGYSQGNSVLSNINFTVKSGELVGLIGPNGAGKSSTIKALLGVLEYIDVDVKMGDYAYIPERPFFYPGLTLMEQFTFLYSTSNLELFQGILRYGILELNEHGHVKK